MKYPAFYKYLLSLPIVEATDYLFDCLVDGGEMAWDLMDEMNGEGWTAKDGQSIVRTSIEKLHEKYGVKNETRIRLHRDSSV